MDVVLCLEADAGHAEADLEGGLGTGKVALNGNEGANLAARCARADAAGGGAKSASAALDSSGGRGKGGCGKD